jgi:hypothetical protein
MNNNNNFKVKKVKHTETQNLNLKYNNTKMPTSPLRSLQRTGSLSTLNLSKSPLGSTWFFTKNPQDSLSNPLKSGLELRREFWSSRPEVWSAMQVLSYG